MKRALLTLLFCLAAHGAFAVTIEQPLADPAQEATAQATFRELKCVVCEGQALGESDAPLAQQMRAEVRGMVGEGKSEAEVLAFFRAHYGERILLNPPVEPVTFLLWLMPLILLLVGAGILLGHVKRGRP